MEDAQRKANTHIVLNFDQCNTLFLVQETINPREVRLTENFMVKLDKRWCDYGKFQKLHMPCSNVGVAFGIKAKVMSSIPSGEIIEEEIVCWVVASIVPWQRSRWV
ncbi:hypothetical protein JHK84_055334 [Glycine max]|nr:hypothetical protein JHK85_056302 [Glycine max]KAG5074103.1 hypothetical protein JHK84_055334 [Glycine max]